MPTNFHRKKTFGGNKTTLLKQAQDTIVAQLEVTQEIGIVCSTRLLRLNLLSQRLLDATKTKLALDQQIRANQNNYKSR